MSCRNGQNWGFKGWRPDELDDALKSPDFREKYLLVIFLWEDRYNNPHAAIVKLAADIPDELVMRVTTTTSTSLTSSLMMGVLWPVQVYKRHTQKTPEKSQIVSVCHNGVYHKGVIREPHHGVPIGCIVLKQKCGVTQAKEVEHENSERAVRGVEQCEDVFKSLDKRMGMQISMPKEDSESEAIAIRHKHAFVADDPLDMVWQMPFAKKATASRSAPRAGRRLPSLQPAGAATSP